MKIVIVAHSSGIQGAGKALLSMIDGLNNNGVETIVTLPSKGPLYYDILSRGYKCHVVWCYNYTIPKRKGIKNLILFLPRLFRIFTVNTLGKWKLNKLVECENPDLIHTNSGVIRFGAEVANKRNIPHVWHIREFQTDNNDYPPIGSEAKLRKAFSSPHNHCLTITHEIFDYYALNPSKDKVLYDGVFGENYFPDIIKEKDNYFLYVGALEEGKGVYELLDAFSKMSQDTPSIELWLAGRDNININKYISSCEYGSRIKYLGFRKDIYELMKKAKALIVPSFFEGFGFTTAEAMINGCLVIGRNTTGTKEQFDNGRNLFGQGIGFRFLTVNELSQIMHTIACNGFDPYYEMALCAQKSAHRYTIEKNVNNLMEIYNNIKNEEL